MGWWSALFATPETVGKLVDDVSSGLDKAFYTDQEKAQNNNKLNDWYLKYLEVTQPQNMSRRLIAIAFCGVYLFLILVAVAVEPFSADYAKYIFKVISDNLTTPVEWVIGFYFVKHIVDNSVYGKGAKQ